MWMDCVKRRIGKIRNNPIKIRIAILKQGEGDSKLIKK